MKYSRKEVMESFIQAVPVLLLPVIILGGIYTGIFTPTEAAVTCVIYSLVLGIAYREMKFSDLISAMKKTIVTSGMVMFIMAMSANFGWICRRRRYRRLWPMRWCRIWATGSYLRYFS